MRLKYQLSLLPLFILIFVFPEKAFSNLHWETIFYADTVFQYTTSKEGEPDTNWRNSDFDASGWNIGKGGIGYSDNDDNTVIETAIALFMRRTFTIHDKKEIISAVLSIDYNDAFVAYINGEEIARSPGLSEGFPAFDELSTADREAQMYQGGNPQDFIITENLISQLLVDGENVMTI